MTNFSLQYNDGVLDADGKFGKQIPRTFLYGIAFSRITLGPAHLELQGLARQEFGADAGFQFTGVWSVRIPHTPLELLGYADWFNHRYRDQPTVFQTEPQLLIRKGSWAVGSEWELSRNFAGAYTERNGFEYRKWYLHPTVFARVDF